MGLRIIEYRARAIGAELKIQSRSNQGTEIHCLLPYQSPGSSDAGETT
jgi:nitrate/nitrite-specific signal transduction histidine kinase